MNTPRTDAQCWPKHWLAAFDFARGLETEYVLCGFNGDTIAAAEKRMFETVDAGFFPCAMLYRDKKGTRAIEWMRWARKWTRPIITASLIRQRSVDKSGGRV